MVSNETVELCRDPIPDVRNASGFGKYYEQANDKIRDYPNMLQQRNEAIKRLRRPLARDGARLIVLIGRTTKTVDEWTVASNEVWSTFGNYNLLTNNCQRFVRELAQKVVPVHLRSDDWAWFMRTVSRAYEYVEFDKIRTPGGVAEMCIKRFEDLKKNGGMKDRDAIQGIDAQIKSLKKYVRRLQTVGASADGGGGTVDGGGGAAITGLSC